MRRNRALPFPFCINWPIDMNFLLLPQALLLACALVLAAGCGMNDKPAPTEPRAAATDKAKAAEGVVRMDETRARYLVVEEVGATSEAQRNAIPGRIEMRSQAVSSLGAPVAGRIVSVMVRPGEAVTAGKVLVTLQSAEAAGARSGLAQSQARAAAAEEALKRQNDMMSKGVGVELERMEAQTRVHEARAELERARKLAGFLGGGDGDVVALRASAAGVVTSVRASAGAMVSPGGESLVEIGNPSQLWMVAEVTEADTAIVARGQVVAIRIPSLGRNLQGRVDGIAARIDPDTRRLSIYVALDGDVRGLTPGLQAELALAKGARGLSLPVTAVLIKEGRRRVVYIQREPGLFELREVRTGESVNNRVLIVDGIKPGDRVVTKGALLLDGEAEQLL